MPSISDLMKPDPPSDSETPASDTPPSGDISNFVNQEPVHVSDRLSQLVAPKKPAAKASGGTNKRDNPRGSPGHIEEVVARWNLINDTYQVHSERLRLIEEAYVNATGSREGLENVREYRVELDNLAKPTEERRDFIMAHPGLRHYNQEFSVAASDLYNAPMAERSMSNSLANVANVSRSDQARRERAEAEKRSLNPEGLYTRQGWGSVFPDAPKSERDWRDYLFSNKTKD